MLRRSGSVAHRLLQLAPLLLTENCAFSNQKPQLSGKSVVAKCLETLAGLENVIRRRVVAIDSRSQIAGGYEQIILQAVDFIGLTTESVE